MTAFVPRIAAFADRWPKLLALLLGAVSATGFAPLNLWPFTLIALAGWIALVARSPKGQRIPRNPPLPSFPHPAQKNAC